MTDAVDSENLLFQSEHHPLVPLEFETRESYCLSLIHRKAYSRAAEMADGLDVLDVGCNTGYGTMKIAERCARVIGVDVSRQAIRGRERDTRQTQHRVSGCRRQEPTLRG